MHDLERPTVSGLLRGERQAGSGRLQGQATKDGNTVIGNTIPTQGEETIADTLPMWPGNGGCSPKAVEAALWFKVRHLSHFFKPLCNPPPLLLLGKTRGCSSSDTALGVLCGRHGVGMQGAGSRGSTCL